MNMKAYVIKKGNHQTGLRISFHSGIVAYAKKFRVTNDWDFDREIKPLQKVCGFSYGHHQWNSSMRLGMKLLPDGVVYKTYIYDRGTKITDQKIISAAYNEEMSLMIYYEDILTKKYAVFSVNGIQRIIPITFDPMPGYYLYPYFKDNNGEPAPRDLVTYISE